MSATFLIRLNDWSGDTTLSVYLYDTGLSDSINGIGDVLIEQSGSGLFEATIDEVISGRKEYWVYAGSTPVYFGFVYCVGSVWYADIEPNSSGPYTVTITVEDEDTNPIADVNVSLKVGSLTYVWDSTAVDGTVVFTVPAGTYTLLLQNKTGYLPYTPSDLTVSVNTSTTVTLTSTSIDPPGDPGVCTVRFLILNNATPVEGATVEVVLEANSVVSSALAARPKTTGTTNASGYVDIEMTQYASFTSGGRYRVVASDENGKELYDNVVTVPTLTTCYADELTIV